MATLPDTKPRPVWTATKAISAVSAFVTGLLVLDVATQIPYLAEVGAVILLVCTVLAPIYGSKVQDKVVPEADVLSYVSKDREVVVGPADAALVKKYSHLPDEVEAPASGLVGGYEAKHRDSAGIPTI